MRARRTSSRQLFKNACCCVHGNVVGGDLNHVDLNEAIGDYPDIKIIETAPSRGDQHLDQAACSFADEIHNTVLHAPLNAITPKPRQIMASCCMRRLSDTAMTLLGYVIGRDRLPMTAYPPMMSTSRASTGKLWPPSLTHLLR